MAKDPKPNTQKKPVRDNIQERIMSLFAKQELPTYMTIRQTEELKARLDELEARLAAQDVEPGEQKTSNDQASDNLKAQVVDLKARLGAKKPAISLAEETTAEGKKTQRLRKSFFKEDEEGKNASSLAMGVQRRIAQWTALVFAIVGLAFFAYAIYNLFLTQQGQADLSDIILIPFTVLMSIVSLISIILIRRDRLSLGGWLLYLFCVIIPPVLASLLIRDLTPIFGGYLIIFSLFAINLVLPKGSRNKAIITSLVAILSILAIEGWNPAFRVGSENLGAFTPIIVILATMAMIVVFFRPIVAGNIRVKLVGAFIGVTLVGIAITGLAAYTNFRNQIRRDISQRLLDIVSITAIQQDGNLHARITGSESMTEHAYQQMMAQDISTIKTVPDLVYLYTMRMDEQGQIYFVIDARQEGDEEIVDVGTVYEEPSAFLYEKFATLDQPVVEEEFYTDEWGTFLSAYAPFYKKDGTREGIVGVDIAADKVLEQERTVLYQIMGAAFAAMLLVGGLGLYLGNTFTKPITNLSSVAQRITEGDLSARATVESRDEIGVLATTFNNMTAQLKNLVESLERRVEERTKDLETASEVGRSITEKVAKQYEMMTEAVDIIRERFNLYYTQIYLVDPSGRNLVLNAGTGEVGAQLIRKSHYLPIGLGSINGRAASEKQAVIIEDTEQSSNFLPNPLLPLTRSEMSIPLMVGDSVVGVLDMQSEQPGALNDANLPAFTTLAGQLAVAIQNASLFAQTAQARSEIEEQARRLTQEGWREFLDGLERGEKIGFRYTQNDILPLGEVFPSTGEIENALSVPIQVTGAKVGEICLQDEPGRVWTESETEIIQATAAQIAQHVENLRLLAQAEKYRVEAEQAVRRLTREGWDEYLHDGQVMESGFVYDGEKVALLEEGDPDVLGAAATYDISVRGEAIGQFVIADTEELSFSDEEQEFIRSVTEQVSAHIENLRLSNQMEQALAVTQESRAALTEAMFIANMSNWELDLSTMKFHVSDRFYEMLGTTADEMGGYELPVDDYLQNFVHPEDAQIIPNAIQAALQNPDPNFRGTVEYRLIRKDGQMRFVSTNYRLAFNEEGQLQGGVGSLLDVTERRLAQELVAKRANQLQTVATLSNATSTVLDPDKLLQAVVDLTKERFHLYHAHIYLTDEILNTLLLTAGAGEVGRKMVGEQHSIKMDAEKSLVARAARERTAVIVNDVQADPGFLPNPLLPETRAEMAVPMIVGDKVLGVFDVQSDIVENFAEEDANVFATLAAQVGVALQNARLYVEQAATVTQLRELDRLKSSFLANMSHELRTPLNSILGFADVMIEELDGPLTENMNNDLQLIQKNGQHLLHLINDVLDMAKIEAGRMNLNPEKFCFHEILEEVTSITSPLASEKSLSLFIESDSDRDVEILADRTRIRQVMLNLVNNAMKFTEKGKISLLTERIEDKILITVRDTGTGIPPDKLDAIFQEFTQVDSSSTRKAGGTGLGLPISRRLIEMHGGRLWAESAGIPGEGSTFFVELPLEAQFSDTIEKQEK